MNKDTEKTKVIFRVFHKERIPDVIAVFPTVAWSNNPYKSCASYMHYGQHGDCDTNIALWTRPAKPSEYKALQEELEFLGYNLQIVKRFTRKDLESRKAQIDEMIVARD